MVNKVADPERGGVSDGNARFEGYVPDILDAIMLFFRTAMNVDVKYVIHAVEDGSYGGKNADTGEWNGMIGELVNGVRATVAPAAAVAARCQLIILLSIVI